MNDPDRLMADLASDDPTVVAAATDRLLALTGGTPSGSQLARASIAAKEALYAAQRQRVDQNGVYHAPPAEPNEAAVPEHVAEMRAVADDLEAAGHSDRAERVRARAEQLLNDLHAPGDIDQGVRGHTVPAPTFDEAIEAARAAGDWERHDRLVLQNLARKIATS